MTADRAAKRPAFLSVDGDSQLDYFRTYNLSPGPAFEDQVYLQGIPRLLDAFATVNARATFFLVGREVLRPSHRRLLRRIVDEGHEIGNHTMEHPADFAALARAEKARQIDEMAACVADVTGKAVAGFRAPVYSIDPVTLDLLEERGYLYDSSVFPSAFFALQQAIIRIKSRERASHVLPGNPLWHFAPKEPYTPDQRNVWRRGDRRIWEIPISVVPGLNLPFYGTFLLWAGMGYFRAAYTLIWRGARPLILQYHPMEVMTLGQEGIDRRLAMLPNISRPVRDKETFIAACLRAVSERFDLMPGGEYLEGVGCLTRARA